MADSPKVRPFHANIMAGVYDNSPDLWSTAYKAYRKADRNEDPLPYSAWSELHAVGVAMQAERDTEPKRLTVTLTEAEWRLLFGAARVGVHALERSPLHSGATGKEQFDEAWRQAFSA